MKKPSPRQERARRYARKRWVIYGKLGQIEMIAKILGNTDPRNEFGVEQACYEAGNQLPRIRHALRKQLLKINVAEQREMAGEAANEIAAEIEAESDKGEVK